MKYSTEFKVGIITLIACGLLAFIISSVGKISFKKEGYQIKVVFPNIAGMKERAPVYLAGVRVGRIYKISLRKDNKVDVVLYLNKEIKIKRKSLFVITTESLLGVEKHIEIVPYQGKEKYLKQGDVVQGEKPIQAREIVEGIKETFDKVQEVSNFVKKLIGEGEITSSVKEILNNLQLSSKQVYELTNKFNNIAKENDEDIREIISNAKETSKNIKDASEKIKTLATDEKINKDFKEIINSVKEATEKLNGILEKVDKEILDKQTATSIKETLKNTNKILSRTNKTLDRLKQTKEKLQLELYHSPSSNKYKTNINLRITPSKSDLFYQFGLNNFSESNVFNIQLGKNIKNVDIRGGVKEGKVGCGFDYLNNKLLFSSDLYNPNELHYNIRTGYKLLTPLYFIWGSEGKLSDKKENFFGLELRK